jgi:hypothetical protein
MILTLTLIAVFILLMAIINFINISIGTSSYRTKEIGLRKVFGGRKNQLVFQHLTESVVISGAAAAISLCLYEIFRPLFGQVLQTHLQGIWQFDWRTLLYFAALVLLVGFAAGIYPAFVLSSSGIVSSAKGKNNTARGGANLRKALLIVQFSLAIFVFIAAINVSRQMSFVFSKDVGYKKEQLMVVTAFPKQWDSAGVLRMEAIKTGLLGISAVQSATLAFEVPDRTPPNTIDLLPAGATKPVVIPLVETDEDYAATFGMVLKEGRFFNPDNPALASNEIVLNETAARLLGVDALSGGTVKMPTGFSFHVTGVVKDYNYSSFQQEIGPMAFIHLINSPRYR